MRKEEGAQGGGGKRGGRGRNKQFKKEIKNTKKTQRMHLNQLMQEEQYRKEEAHVSNRHTNTSLQTPSHLKWDPWKPRSAEVCRRLAVIDSVHAVMAIAVCVKEKGIKTKPKKTIQALRTVVKWTSLWWNTPPQPSICFSADTKQCV